MFNPIPITKVCLFAENAVSKPHWAFTTEETARNHDMDKSNNLINERIKEERIRSLQNSCGEVRSLKFMFSIMGRN